MRLITWNNYFNLRNLSLYLIDGSQTSRYSSSSRRLIERIEGDKRMEHLQLTSKQLRQEVIAEATIISKNQASDTVKTLCLKIENPEFSFKAGQWVDLFIPGLDVVSGFSMWSSPLQLKINKTINLAVKYSTHPPAYWIHTQSKIGSVVKVRSGGDFYYDENSTSAQQNLLLIAGGVGINPLSSILHYVADMYKHPSDFSSISKPEKITLLFSAKTNKELLFKDLFLGLSKDIPSISCKFFTTKEILEERLPGNSSRIKENDLQEVIGNLGQNSRVYICGPSPMISDMEQILLKLGVSSSYIHYEKWW